MGTILGETTLCLSSTYDLRFVFRHTTLSFGDPLSNCKSKQRECNVISQGRQTKSLFIFKFGYGVGRSSVIFSPQEALDLSASM